MVTNHIIANRRFLIGNKMIEQRNSQSQNLTEALEALSTEQASESQEGAVQEQPVVLDPALAQEKKDFETVMSDPGLVKDLHGALAHSQRTHVKTTPLLNKLMERADLNNHTAPIKQTWEQVEEIYQINAQGLVDMAGAAEDAISFIRQSGMPIDAELKAHVSGFKKDLDRFTTELVKIREHHSGKTGVIKNEDELAQSIQIFDQYCNTADHMKALIMPSTLLFAERAGDAELYIEEQKRQKDLQNPNVISDIEVKA
jgi:hypothetical protein